MKLAAIVCVGMALLLAACDSSSSSGRPSDSYTSSVHEADAARKSGDIEIAVALYQRALQANPGGLDAKLGLGQCFLALGAGDDAAAQFRDVLDRRGTNVEARRGLATALILEGQPTLAMQQAEIAVQADARDYKALNVMGIALDILGRHTDAQAQYAQGLQIAPADVALRSNMALSLAISGQAPQAIALLVPIANGRDADARVRQNLAFAYVMAGGFENALQICRRDLDEAQAQQQLSYFMQLKSMPPDVRSAAIRRNPAFFPQPGAAPQPPPGAGKSG